MSLKQSQTWAPSRAPWVRLHFCSLPSKPNQMDLSIMTAEEEIYITHRFRLLWTLSCCKLNVWRELIWTVRPTEQSRQSQWPEPVTVLREITPKSKVCPRLQFSLYAAMSSLPLEFIFAGQEYSHRPTHRSFWVGKSESELPTRFFYLANHGCMANLCSVLSLMGSG